ncbi:MAG: Uncharacterized protein XD41_0559 [Desulfonauticus sp. 38_4375]|nr:MAG: Uncharacterized protein XD41_0559 [Desulfonauticus sp. 38_4375]
MVLTERKDLALLLESGRLKKIRAWRQSMVIKLLEEGKSAREVSLAISRFNEALAIEVCNYFARRFPWLKKCVFLEFGSGGRGEQVLGSDQDNGLVLPKEKLDEAQLEEVCQRIVLTLDGAGLPLCPGKVMISEEKWRGTLEEWKRKILFWLENPKERGPWQSGLILDFKPLYGEKEKIFQLRTEVLETIRKHPVIWRLLVEEILQFRVPLSFLGNFILEKKGEERGINLKKSILAHLINATRLLSLKYGFVKAHTLERLSFLIQKGHVEEKMGKELQNLWEWAQAKRLRQALEQKGEINFLNPHLLPKEEKKLLKKRLNYLQKFVDLVSMSANYGL